jgi:tRNA-dihydrouridine synthase
MKERVATAKKHLEFSVEWKGERKGIYEMRRHYTNYFKGIPGIKPYRTQLVESGSAAEISDLLDAVGEEFDGYFQQQAALA